MSESNNHAERADAGVRIFEQEAEEVKVVRREPHDHFWGVHGDRGPCSIWSGTVAGKFLNTDARIRPENTGTLDEQETPQINLVQNWFEELTRLVPTP